VAAAADPARLRKLRRDNADMLAFPLNMFSYARMMRRVPAFRKPPGTRAGAFAPKSKCWASIAHHPRKAGRHT